MRPADGDWLRDLPAVRLLRLVWLQNYYAPDPVSGAMRLRAAADLPPKALMIESPYDLHARFHAKSQTSWTGYTVHLTETCDADRPLLITQVATVSASTNDGEMTDVIEEDLTARDLPPGEHLLDAGIVSVAHLLRAPRATASRCSAPRSSARVGKPAPTPGST